MKSWPTKPIGDLLKIQNGFAFESDRFNDAKRGLPIIRIRDLARSYSETFFDGEHDTAYEVNDGDFLIGMDGEFRCYRWNGGKALLNQRVCRLQSFDPTLNSSYVFYGINRHLSEIEANTSFVTVKHLSSKQIAQIKMPVPPLEEQERIVKLLDEADELRKLRTQADRRTSALIPALFHKMFGDTLVNEKGWRMSELENLSSNITDGKHGDCRPSPNSGYYFVSVKDIVDGRIDYSKAREIMYEDFVEVHKRTRLEEGDVLITNSGTIGRTAVVAPVAKVAKTTFQKSVAIIKPIKDCIHPVYLRSVLDKCVNNLTTASSGSAQKNLLLGQLRHFQICVPPMLLQSEFAQRVTEIRELEAGQATSRTRLDALFQSLLHRAFNGEL